VLTYRRKPTKIQIKPDVLTSIGTTTPGASRIGVNGLATTSVHTNKPIPIITRIVPTNSIIQFEGD
jgi:hypothetical protein